MQFGTTGPVLSPCVMDCDSIGGGGGLLNLIYNYINRFLLILLIAGLILISCLTYRKYRGNKGLWGKLILRDLLFCAIIFLAWIVVNVLLWQPELKSTI